MGSGSLDPNDSREYCPVWHVVGHCHVAGRAKSRRRPLSGAPQRPV